MLGASWLGAGFIVGGTMTTGELMTVMTYSIQILTSLMMLSMIVVMIAISRASAERVAEVLDEKSDITNPALPGPEAFQEPVDGSIDFENVSFRYAKEAKEMCLKDIDLHIPAGATVGIIGGTGAGKSSLVQLIPRLYDVTEGAVKLGGRDVREYDLETLRKAVGMVLQKNVLFSGTVRENLLWGDPNATDDQLWDACRQACADEFLEKMPKGLDTDLGQGGVNLSGGQKQRLCIARTLLKHPKVLIFDDSTSAVDTATEAKIRTSLAQLTDVTKIIIAQRITSVMNADQIVILEDGAVHVVGSHNSLLAQDSIYQEIYSSQLKGKEESAS